MCGWWIPVWYRGLRGRLEEVGGSTGCLKPIWLYFTGTSTAFPNQSPVSQTRAGCLSRCPPHVIDDLTVLLNEPAHCNSALFSLILLHCLTLDQANRIPSLKLVRYFLQCWKDAADRWLYSDSMCIWNVLLSKFGTFLSTAT